MLKAWLNGQQPDLEYLNTLIPSGDVQVGRDGDRFYLTAAELDGTAACEAEETANRLVAWINGLASVRQPGYQPVEFAGAFQLPNGGVNVMGVAARMVIRTSLTATGVAVGADGKAALQPPPGPGNLARAASDPKVARALVIMGTDPRPEFPELYVVHEIVQSTGTERLCMQAAGIPPAELDRFTHTANFVARHAAYGWQSPKNPMPLNEARELIGKLVVAWLDRGP